MGFMEGRLKGSGSNSRIFNYLKGSGLDEFLVIIFLIIG